MASCRPTARTPGSPTSCSGYASRLAANAIRCDQARLLSRLQSGCCGPSNPVSNKSALYASILEQDAAKGCQVLSARTSSSTAYTASVLALPTTGVPSSVLTQQIIQQTILNSTSPTNPSTRFSSYDRTIVPLLCPIAVPNTAIPVPSMNGPCHVWPGS